MYMTDGELKTSCCRMRLRLTRCAAASSLAGLWFSTDFSRGGVCDGWVTGVVALAYLRISGLESALVVWVCKNYEKDSKRNETNLDSFGISSPWSALRIVLHLMGTYHWWVPQPNGMFELPFEHHLLLVVEERDQTRNPFAWPLPFISEESWIQSYKPDISYCFVR